MKLNSLQIKSLANKVVEKIKKHQKETLEKYKKELKNSSEYKELVKIDNEIKKCNTTIEELKEKGMQIIGTPNYQYSKYVDKYIDNKVREANIEHSIDADTIKDDIVINTISLEEGQTLEDVLNSIVEKYIKK